MRTVRALQTLSALLLLPSLAFAQTLPQAPPTTRATFLSESVDAWNVAVDGNPLCATPCTLDLSPYQFTTLLSQEDNPLVLEVGRLPPGDLVITGRPLHGGMRAGGIVATTLGGMAAVVGVTLTTIGAAKDRQGVLTAGLINLGVGAVTVAGGIWLMVRALPSVTVTPQAGPRVAGATFGLGGTF